MSQVLAKEAVEIVKDHLRALGRDPHEFSPQIALCNLLEWADNHPGDEVAEWILSGDRERLWCGVLTDPAALRIEGDDPTHERFRKAWQEFLDNDLPTM